MTQAWAWVNRGYVDLETLSDTKADAKARIPVEMVDLFHELGPRQFAARLRKDGWHLKRVKVEPVEG